MAQTPPLYAAPVGLQEAICPAADCHAVSLDNIFAKAIAILHAVLWALTQLVKPLRIYYDCAAPADDAQGFAKAPNGLEAVMNVI